MKKALNVIGNVFVTLILIFAVLITVLVITSTKSEAGVPNLFGYALMNVESDSMESEQGFYTGDLIIIRLIDENEANNLNIGDVITFKRFLNNIPYLETHRIVENVYETVYKSEVKDGIRIHNGTKCYVTKGDNTPAVDFMQNGELDYATKNNVYGIWEGKRVPHLGAAIKFLKSQMGFMVCIIIPLALLFFYELYSFIVTMNEKRKATALAEVAASEEEIRQKAIAEFLAQQQAAQASADTAPAEGPDAEAGKENDGGENHAEQPPKAEEQPAAEVPEDMTPPEKTE